MLYELQARAEMETWKLRMRKAPSMVQRLSHTLQARVNRIIPEKVHRAITATIREMVRGVLFGSKYTVPGKQDYASFADMESAVRKRTDFYKHTAAAEGGVTGAGGILLGLADFPILLSMKLKLLFDIATIYGFDVKDYRERLYILLIFQLAFSSQDHRRKVFSQMEDWARRWDTLPEKEESFDWRAFQQEYRDYLDIAKMAQLMPVIGAAVGVVVNYRLVKKLGETAINAYRMRLLR
ncbi:EcsC family protein [Chitinophaga rhizosphaerae]|uniref:EcsC family protein n=1 Tax=Chitinophaga rhizosphaerae TaxID=1864947 RepID=UPI000F7FC8E0|nr:EcsC family protein [Chitinophaga rhizosphaerae]